MAQKKSGSPEKATIHRITAKDNTPVQKAAPISTESAQKKSASAMTDKKDKRSSSRSTSDSATENENVKNPFTRFGRYVKGAWYELKQVRWPTRSATWSMTVAVLLFSAAFVVFITLLDAGFNWLFELILN